MNRCINEVFPTPVSPKMMTLSSVFFGGGICVCREVYLRTIDSEYRLQFQDKLQNSLQYSSFLTTTHLLPTALSTFTLPGLVSLFSFSISLIVSSQPSWTMAPSSFGSLPSPPQRLAPSPFGRRTKNKKKRNDWGSAWSGFFFFYESRIFPFRGREGEERNFSPRVTPKWDNSCSGYISLHLEWIRGGPLCVLVLLFTGERINLDRTRCYAYAFI